MNGLVLLALAATAVAARDNVPSPPLGARRVNASDVTLNFLSATFGDHMVLQRAPAAAVFFGFTAVGATVTTVLDGDTTLTTTADDAGVWRQALPPIEASLTAHALSFTGSEGETAALEDVLFGDVYLCGGQSNMQFSMPAVTNATAEIARAGEYPQIRLFTVGDDTSSDTPLDDLQTVSQPWTVASNASVAADGGFGGFSAVCWFFGVALADAHAGLPLGLVSNNWGGTSVEQWTTAASFEPCGRAGEPTGELYNAMIQPYTVGPMALAGFTWYQGEANTASQDSADDYACLFPAMIGAWRAAFGAPDAFFGFVQLSTWCKQDGIPEMREAQMKALENLDNVGYATNADHGAGCNIHPPPKQYCGARLSVAARSLVYGDADAAAWRSPSYAKVTSAFAGGGKSMVNVTLNDVSGAGLDADVAPANWVDGVDCDALEADHAGTCAWAAIEVEDVGWVNASVTVWNHTYLVLEAPMPDQDTHHVLATSYGWGMIPMMSVYDKGTGLPLLPWRADV